LGLVKELIDIGASVDAFNMIGEETDIPIITVAARDPEKQDLFFLLIQNQRGFSRKRSIDLINGYFNI